MDTQQQRGGNDISAAKEMARLYLERGRHWHVLAVLQQCLAKEPADIECLGLLALTFDVIRRPEKSITVYRLIARHHREAGRADECATALRAILRIDPNDAEARRLLGLQGPTAADVEELDLDDIELIQDSDLLRCEDRGEELEIPIDVVADGEGDVDASLEAEATEPVIPDRRTRVRNILVECEALARYGLESKVAERLRLALELDPSHVGARERLVEALLVLGEKRQAIDELYELAGRFEVEWPEVARRSLERIVALDAQSEPARSQLRIDWASAGGFDAWFADEVTAKIPSKHRRSPMDEVTVEIDARY